MGRPGFNCRAAPTTAYRKDAAARCNLVRACHFVRRLCSSEMPSYGLTTPASRRRTPDIKAWSGSSSVVDKSLISTSCTPVATGDNRLRVAVDVDEVLGRFVYTLNKFCKDQYDMEYGVGDYWIYEFAKIWGCSQERSNQIVHEFFRSQHFKDGIPVVPGALEALTRLSESNYELVVVTSRQHVIQDATLRWLDRHYSGLFQEVYFGNHFALEGKSQRKSDICRTIGARVLIDDNPSYALECAAAGIHVLLYDWGGAYPWSKLPPHAGAYNPDLIRVVQDWGEVERELASLAQRLRATADNT